MQLRDQLDDLQLNWAAHVHPHLDRCHELLDALNARFGQLADEGMHEPSDLVDPQTNTISVNALRHFLAIFVILYRHLWLWAHCSESALEAAPGAPVINKYHVEAGLELFNELAMVATVPPAARLLYKQDFRGMYHNMSQVVYFHFPDYNAPLQLELEALQRGQSYHALAPLHEVAPDVPIRMEDDDLSAESKCFVLLAGGYVFLWRGPDDIVFCRNVFAVIS